MVSRLKDIIRIFVYGVVDFFIHSQNTARNKTLLLIRLDAIGDYVLFRNFIEILQKSTKYKDYKITLLGNIVWKELAVALDSEYIDTFIWLDRKKFEKNLFYRYKKLKEINAHGYEIILNPVYSREFYYGDWITRIVYAKEKIASMSDLSNIKIWQKCISNKYYTQLISARQDILFEFYRNREFIEQLLNEQIDVKRPSINITKIRTDITLPTNYAILFLGASASYRKWSIPNFVKVAEYLQSNYQMNIVLAGGRMDIDDAKEFKLLYKGENLYDFVGKTNLIELLKIIHNGNFMVTNETSAPHFSIALETTETLVIFNGNHFGRFTPYPKEISKIYHVVYHPEIEKDLVNYQYVSNSYGFKSQLNISEISVKSVIKKIDEVLLTKIGFR